MLIKNMVSHFTDDDITYVTLDSLVEYIQPTQYIVKSTDYDPKVGTPVLTAGASFILGYTHETENIFNAMPNRPVIIFDDFTTSFHWVDFSFKVKSSALKILKVRDESKSLFKYIYYAMRCIEYRPSQHGRQWIQTYSKFRIPLPPLPIQEEIVRVLDKFTLLKAELEAELEARTVQYEHYRDALLDFSINRSSIIKELIEDYSIQTIEYKSLAEIATEMYRGTGITRSQITEAGIPCVRYGEIYTTYRTFFDKCVSFTNEKSIKNPKYFGYGDILFAITGENVEEISKSTAYIGNEVCLAGGDIVVMKHEQNPKYLAYALSTTNAQRQKSKGKIKSKVVHSSVPDLKKITIPVPPLPVQQAIVDILDRFEAIVHDIKVGLPAETALRQKQYDYYRNKLLEFPILS